MLRDRAMSHYQARSLFGSNHRLNRRNGLGFDRRPVMDRGVGATVSRRSILADSMKLKEIEGEPLVDANALKSLIRLLRLTQVIIFFMVVFIVNSLFCQLQNSCLLSPVSCPLLAYIYGILCLS